VNFGVGAGTDSGLFGEISLKQQNFDLADYPRSADEFFGGSRSKPYVGRVLESPTWGKLLAEARKVQRATRDEHHVFLEGASVRHVDGGVQVIELFFGS
jgi:hypothetical protein